VRLTLRDPLGPTGLQGQPAFKARSAQLALKARKGRRASPALLAQLGLKEFRASKGFRELQDLPALRVSRDKVSLVPRVRRAQA
jgi:hypothetical protein